MSTAPTAKPREQSAAAPSPFPPIAVYGFWSPFRMRMVAGLAEGKSLDDVTKSLTSTAVDEPLPAAPATIPA